MATLLAVNNYYYRRGGAEYIFLEHNKLFEDNGWQVIPFAMKHPKNDDSPWQSYFADTIEFGQDYHFFRKAVSAQKIIYSFEAQKKIAALLETGKIDICHCHNIYHHISPSILPVIKKYNVPLVMTLHDLKLACPNYQMLARDGICERCKGGKFYHALAHKCLKNSYALSAVVMLESYLHRYWDIYQKNIDHFIVPSRFLKQKLSDWGMDAKKITCISNFIDPEQYTPNYGAGKAFVYFGRLGREKGVATLIKAAKQTDVELLIAGDGQEKDKLARLSGELGCKASFLGHLSPDKLKAVVGTCRAAILPSEWYENAPISILEAYALGKPVIGAKIGGIPEMIDEHTTGLTFQSGSVEELSQQISAIKEMNDSQVSEMGVAGRTLVERQFSKAAYLEKIQGLYHNLMN